MSAFINIAHVLRFNMNCNLFYILLILTIIAFGNSNDIAYQTNNTSHDVSIPTSIKIRNHDGIYNINQIIVSQPEFIVITFSTSDYMASALTWYDQLLSCGVDNHYIVVYSDYKLKNLMGVIGRDGNPARIIRSAQKTPFHFQSVMGWRVRTISHFLHHNISILAADTDSIWVKNPLPEYFSVEDRRHYDLISSFGSTVSRPLSVSLIKYILISVLVS
jgi:hypothetical protein